MVVQEWFPVLTEMIGNKFFNLRITNSYVGKNVDILEVKILLGILLKYH